MRVYKTYPNLGVVGVLESRTRNFLVRVCEKSGTFSISGYDWVRLGEFLA